MSTWIDWHSHDSAPEVAQRIAKFTGSEPHVDKFDAPNFSQRVKEMDEIGLDLQLICQGAGVYADRSSADHALAERIAPYRVRLTGVTALSLKNIDASVAELGGPRSRGFARRYYILQSMARW